MKKLTSLALLAPLALSGCAHLTVGHGDEPPSHSRHYVMHNWVLGIFGDQLRVEPNERVEIHRGPLCFIASIATAGLWIPYSVEVWSAN